MFFLDSFKTSLGSLWANKLRSFLTLLGIVIGIYAVVTLLSVAQGIQKQISDQVEGLGPRTILVLPGESDSSEGGSPNLASQFAPSTLKTDDITLLTNKADLLEPNSIDYAIILGGTLKAGDKKATVLPMGGTLGVADNLGLKTIAQGRAMNPNDLTQKTATVFLTQSTADKLGVKVGDMVTLGKTSLKVTGIYQAPENAGLNFGDSQTPAIVPATLARDIIDSDQINRIIMKAKNVDQIDAAKSQVTKLISDQHGTSDFTVFLSSDLLKSVTQITDILKYAVVGIAAISLLVGGIGISNIMLVTVTERTREIGIRKAVGATEGAILTQFLIESVVLTVIGSLIGIGLAVLTTQIAAKVSPLKPDLNMQTMLLAVAMGAVAGIIFGLFPAFRAARKNPVEALRFE